MSSSFYGRVSPPGGCPMRLPSWTRCRRPALASSTRRCSAPATPRGRSPCSRWPWPHASTTWMLRRRPRSTPRPPRRPGAFSDGSCRGAGADRNVVQVRFLAEAGTDTVVHLPSPMHAAGHPANVDGLRAPVPDGIDLGKRPRGVEEGSFDAADDDFSGGVLAAAEFVGVAAAGMGPLPLQLAGKGGAKTGGDRAGCELAGQGIARVVLG